MLRNRRAMKYFYNAKISWPTVMANFTIIYEFAFTSKLSTHDKERHGLDSDLLVKYGGCVYEIWNS